jgi:type IV pilus assembly protein PilC
MAIFSYEAMDNQGKEVRGEIEANSEREATEKIRAANLYPTRIDSKAGAQSGGRSTARSGATGARASGVKKTGGFSLSFSVKPKHLAAFTRQFSTLLDAGLPVVRSLDILQNQQRTGLLKNTILEVQEDVKGGSSLSEALQRHGRVFDKLYVNMVRAGEASGALETVLTRLAEYMEKALKLRQKIIGALIYPAAVITIAGLILAGIMIWIIPVFEKMFVELAGGKDLPALTRLLLGIANTMRDFWYLIVLTPILIVVGIRLFGKTPKGRYYIDLFKLKMPVFGVVISKSSISRFCRTLGTLVQSGVPILDALAIIRHATGNAVVANAVENVHNAIREGDTIADPLRNSGVFDDIVVNMIQVGEETGELDKMLIKIADNYDSEVDTVIGALMSLLEPVLIVFMGVTVGFIVISLFLPLIDIMQTLGQS